MKVGAENKKKVVGAVVLLVIAALLFVRMLSSPKPPALTPSAAPSENNSPKAPGGGRGSPRDARSRFISYALQPTLDPEIRLDLLQSSEEVKYTGTGRNIFREHLEEVPKPLAPGLTKNAEKAAAPAWAPPAPAGPPPINLKFYGWASQPGQARAIFLSQGDSVYVAHEGDIIARRYKVLRITPNSVEIQDVLSNNTQSIPLIQS